MNWLSHWDEHEDLEHTAEETTFDFKIPTEEEINDLFDVDNERVTYKSHPSISTNEYKKAPSLKLTLDSLKEGILQENMTECVCKIEVKKDDLIRCPHCGESYYVENYSVSTAVYYPPIYKDGVNINPDRNQSITHCTCMNCGKEFDY